MSIRVQDSSLVYPYLKVKNARLMIKCNLIIWKLKVQLVESFLIFNWNFNFQLKFKNQYIAALKYIHRNKQIIKMKYKN